MAVAETAKLIVDLSLTGNYKSSLAGAQRSFNTLGKTITNTQGRAYKAGQQIGTGIQRGAVIAVAAVTSLVGILALSAKEGADAARVQTIYANAIANSGKVSAAYVDALNAQQKALENLAGIDDELIKTEQTRLIQMGLTGKQVLALTPAILDLSKATGIDLLTATKLVGKSVNGNSGALARYGIFVDKAKAKTDPFGATLDALNKKFGGTTKALSGDLPTRMAAFNVALQDIRESAGQKLLPVLTKIVDVAGKDLVPAFGKFIDRILPDVIKGLDEFSNLLANGGAEKGINAITDALVPLVQLVKIAAAPVKAIVGAFLSLPKEVQTVLVGAFAVNKLTGGLVTNVTGGIAGEIAKFFGQKIGIMKVTAGVVQVTGGVGAPGGGVPSVAAGGLSTIAKVALVGEAVGLVLAVNAVRQSISDASSAQATGIASQTAQFIASQPKEQDLKTALAGVEQGIHDLEFNPLNVLVQGDALDKLRQMRADLQAALARIGMPAINPQGGVGNKPYGPMTDTQIAKEAASLASAAANIQAAAAQRDTETSASINQIVAQQAKATDIDTLRVSAITGFTLTSDAAKQAGMDMSTAAYQAGQSAAAASTAAGYNVAGAIAAKDLSISQAINIDVNVSAAGVSKSVTVQNRYGPGNGSAGGGRDGEGGGGPGQ